MALACKFNTRQHCQLPFRSGLQMNHTATLSVFVDVFNSANVTAGGGVSSRSDLVCVGGECAVAVCLGQADGRQGEARVRVQQLAAHAHAHALVAVVTVRRHHALADAAAVVDDFQIVRARGGGVGRF